MRPLALTLIVLTITLIGCTAPAEVPAATANESTPAPPPKPVLNLGPAPRTLSATVYTDDAELSYAAYIQFASERGEKLAVTGQATETWTDAKGAVLLTRTFNVYEEDFVRGTTMLGAEVYAYQWTHSFDEFAKSLAKYPSDVVLDIDFSANTGEQWADVKDSVGLEELLVDPTPAALEIDVARGDEGYLLELTMQTASGTSTVAAGRIDVRWVDELGETLANESVSFAPMGFSREYEWDDWAVHHLTKYENLTRSYADSYSDLTAYAVVVSDGGQTWGSVEVETTLAEEVEARLSDRIRLEVLSDGWECKYVGYGGSCYSQGYAIELRMTNVGKVPFDISTPRLKAHVANGATFDWDGDGDEPEPPSILDVGATASWKSFFELPSGSRADRLLYTDYGGDAVSVPIA